jgi:hypothetical protein
VAEPRRAGRSFAPPPPGIVRVRLEGESAGELAAKVTALPGVSVVTGPDKYPGGRLYLTVALTGEGESLCVLGAALAGSPGALTLTGTGRARSPSRPASRR